MANLFIPPLGTKITLGADWYFALHDEYKNGAMIRALKALPSDRFCDEKNFAWVSLPAGTVLTLRTYRIRLGQAASDRVTFTAKVGKASHRFWVHLKHANLIDVADPAPHDDQ